MLVARAAAATVRRRGARRKSSLAAASLATDARPLRSEDAAVRPRRAMRRSASMTGFSPSEIICKKRDGQQLTAEEIDWFVGGFHRGYIEQFQMSALLMAICTRGMNTQEASDLTGAMLKSGKRADLSSIRPGTPKVDKHSSGGIGDKVSLILAPLVASLDVVVPMMSGRSLGHTGGTLDKLDSVPGLRTEMDTDEYMRQLEAVGAAIVAPTTDFCPVEKTIYSIRDVAGCVEDVALVASSIMSKKLAERPDALLLDVKVGRGAFAKCLNDAAALASMMVSIGENAGIDTCCLLTDMNAPLGSAVGNWVEMREAVRVLRGEPAGDEGSAAGTHDLRELALSQASIMLGLAGKAQSFAEGFAIAEGALDSGAAFDKLIDIVDAQGGDTGVLHDLTLLPLSERRLVFRAPEDAIVQDIDALDIGMASMLLGAGRRYANDPIDHHAGLLLHAKVGETVRKGDPVFTALVGDQAGHDLFVLGEPERRLQEGFERALGAISLAPDLPEYVVQAPPIIEYFVDRTGMTPFKTMDK